MTKCLRSLQRIGLRRNVWRTCLLAGSALLAMSLFFSCNQNVRPGSGTGGAIEKTYTVNHNWEKVDGTGYDTAPQTGLKGLVGSETKAVAQEKEGFELDTAKHSAGKIKQENIKADGSTVVNIYYARKTITLTFDPNGGKIDGKAEMKKLTGKFGTKVLTTYKPEKDADTYTKYTFMGWEPKVPNTFPSKDETYKAVWEKGEHPSYTVEHRLQQIDSVTGKVYNGDKYEEPNYALKDSESKNGKEGSLTEAVAKEYEGFDKPTITQKNITADGKTVVVIYYLRKQVTLTFDPNGGKFGASTDNKTVQGKYGEKVTDSIVTPSKASMKFDGWKSEKGVENNPPATFPEKDTTYTAQWKSRESANYTVRHWKQPISGDTYKNKVEESLSGIVDEDTQAQAKTYEGFHLSKVRHVDGKIVQQKIKADGKTVVDIYYDRNIFTAKFNTDGGNLISDISGRYEAELLSPTEPKKAGKEFVKWEPPVPASFTKNTEHKAIWQDPPLKQANYKVEHWLQEIDSVTGKVYDAAIRQSPNYTKKDSETKSGKVDESTTAVARDNYKGFTALPLTQATIKEDHSTVVKIYYVRKAVTLTFDANGGKIGSESIKSLTGKYGEKIQEAAVGKPERDDADFDAWDPILAQNFPDEDKGYTAQWKIVKELEIRHEPTKKEYVVDEAFDKTNLEVYVKYTNAPERKLIDTDYEIAGFDSSAVGTKTITITYKKKSASFTVTVKAPAPPSETYVFGDIIGKDGNKHKKDGFTPEAGKTWQDYYVIISVNGNTYVGAQYIKDALGWVFNGTQPANTYAKLAESGNRYLTKEEVHAVLAQKDLFQTSLQSTGCDTTYVGNFSEINILYSTDNGENFFNGNDIAVGKYQGGSYIPIAARTFN